MKIYQIAKAFSLVEMMVSLIAVSVLLGVFVPVVTKRVKPSIHTAVSSASIPTPNCSEPFSDYCLLCHDTKECIVCTIPCPVGTTKNTKTCTCESCSDTNSCTECPDGTYLENGACKPCPDGFYCTNSTKNPCTEGFYCTGDAEIPCIEGYYCINGIKTPCEDGKWSNPESSSCALDCPEGYYCKDGTRTQCDPGTYSTAGASTCTTCEEGFYCTGGSNHSSCESKTPHCATCDAITGDCATCTSPYELKSLKCKMECPLWTLPFGEDGICMSKFNIGDFVNGVGADIPTAADVTVVYAATKCDDKKCCWQGSTTTCNSGYGGNYSGCNRTVCNWYAANAICTALGGSLPTVDQVKDAMINYSRYIKNNGLQFCGYISGPGGFSDCYYGGYNCKGSYGPACDVPSVWAMSYNSTDAYRVTISNSSIRSTTINKSSALSVRCIFN